MWDMLTWKPHENGKQLTIINSPNDSAQQGITPSEEFKGTLQGMPSFSVEVLEEECVILIAVVQISAQSYFLTTDACLTNPVSRMETIKPSCLLEAPMLCQFNPDFKTVIDKLTWLEMLCSTPSLKQQSVCAIQESDGYAQQEQQGVMDDALSKKCPDCVRLNWSESRCQL
ncbi:hypothetical protein J3A83DRAFT_4184850 [Scleroderma citrinum]